MDGNGAVALMACLSSFAIWLQSFFRQLPKLSTYFVVHLIDFFAHTIASPPPWGTWIKDSLLMKNLSTCRIWTHDLKSFAPQACTLLLLYSHCPVHLIYGVAFLTSYASTGHWTHVISRLPRTGTFSRMLWQLSYRAQDLCRIDLIFADVIVVVRATDVT